MPTVRHVEGTIQRVEGFAVKLRYAAPGRQAGRDIRSDRTDFNSYPYSNAAPRSYTVAEWREKRLEKTYAGITADVLDGDGRTVHGRTLLSSVRESYG